MRPYPFRLPGCKPGQIGLVGSRDYPRYFESFSKVAIVTHGLEAADVDGKLIPFRTDDVFVIHGNRPNDYFGTENLTMTNV